MYKNNEIAGKQRSGQGYINSKYSFVNFFWNEQKIKTDLKKVQKPDTYYYARHWKCIGISNIIITLNCCFRKCKIVKENK